jgi:hypothetical protein
MRFSLHISSGVGWGSPEGVGQAFQPVPDAAAAFTMSLQAAGRTAGRYRVVFRSCHSRSSGQQGRRIDVT